jgi:hypothetical protein
MAYSNAIFRTDYVNGSNAPRTALTSVTVTNNGGIIRCTKVGHGWVTGAVVTASIFTTVEYNTTHIINRIDDDIFELFSSRATGTITITGTPVADETFVVGAQTFTFKASRASAGQVTISSDNVQQAKNICTAIMTDIPTSVIAFVGTRLQPSNQYSVTIDNLNAGTTGNSTVLTAAATGIAVSGSGTLAGGAQVAYSANDSGTITPFGGSSWADAWQDITSGATAARIAPGDAILVAKSTDPIGCVSAQFTDLSKTVTLQALTSCSFADNGSGGVRVTKANHNIYDTAIVAVTLSTDYNGDWATDWIDANNFDLVGATYVADRSGTVTPKFTLAVDMCETAWTGVNSGVVARTAAATDGKEGSYCMQITAPASPATATEYAYYAITSTDFSKYQKLTFWLKNEVAVLATHWKICLCSDNAGATIVDTFEIPAIPSTGQWVALTIAKTGGGNCGNAIQSIALWSATVAPTASKYLRVDCFNCATTIGLNQQSLISKSSLANGTYASEMWFALQSISGNTLLIDNYPNTLATAGRGYSGTTEIVVCYLRETIKTSLAAALTTVIQEVQDSGIFGNSSIVFLGGFNTTTSIQDGETFFDGLNGFGYGFQAMNKSFLTIFHLNFVRYYCAFYYYGGYEITIATEVGNSSIGFYTRVSVITYIKYLKAYNNLTNGIYFNNSFMNYFDFVYSHNNIGEAILTTAGSGNNTFFNCGAKNSSHGVNFYTSQNNFIYNLITSGNTTTGVGAGYGVNYLINPTISESTKVNNVNLYCRSKVLINKYAGDVNDNRVYGDGFYAISQATIRHTASGLADQVFVNLTHRTSAYKARLKIMPVVFCKTPNKAITCSVYIKKSHGTDIEASIFCQGGQILRVASDVESTPVGNDTDWVKKSITFTPTEVGGVEIYGLIWWLANAADENVVFDDAECTQAA